MWGFYLKVLSRNKSKITVNRSAVTGKFVSEKYANNHPKTTEKEHYRGKN